MPVALVHKMFYNNPGNIGAATVPLGFTVTPGNALIVVMGQSIVNGFVGTMRSDTDTLSVADDGVNAPANDSVVIVTTSIYYTLNSGAATSITFVTSGNLWFWAYEVSGNALALDVTNQVDQQGNPVLPITSLLGPALTGGVQGTLTANVTDAPATHNFGLVVVGASFKDASGDAFYAYGLGAGAVGDSTYAITGVSGSPTWTLDTLAHAATLGSAYVVVSTPIPPPATPCAPVDVSGDPVNGVFINDLSLFIIPATALYDNLVPFSAIRSNESSAQGRKQIILDFNNNEGLYVRDFGTIFTWSLQAGTILDVWQPSVIPMDGEIYDRLSYHCLMTSLGSVGWQHAREMNIAYAAPSPLTLLLTFDQWPNITLTLPASSAEIKQKLTLPPNKFKLVEMFLSSAQPFKLWTNDLEMKVKTWGSNEPYRVARPVSG